MLDFFDATVNPNTDGQQCGGCQQANDELHDFETIPIIGDDFITLSACDFSCVLASCEIKVTLLGSDTGIRSTNGQPLDGNKDGMDGGEFVYTQVINNCNTTVIYG